MSIVTWVKQTRFGAWLIEKGRSPAIGSGLRRIARGIRRVEHRMISRKPEHRAHDAHQNAVLAAFEARIGPAGLEPNPAADTAKRDPAA